MKKFLFVLFFILPVILFAQESEPTVEDLLARIENLEARNAELRDAYEDLFFVYETQRRDTEQQNPSYVYVTQFPLVRTNEEILNPYFNIGVLFNMIDFSNSFVGTMGVEVAHRMMVEVTYSTSMDIGLNIGWMF
jgi:hypothetical protein